MKKMHIELEIQSEEDLTDGDIFIHLRELVETIGGYKVFRIDRHHRKELESEMLSYFAEFLKQHPEQRDKAYIYREQRMWTPQDIYDKLVTDKTFYRMFEKDLLMLCIDLLMRGKENVESFTISAVV